MLFKCGDFYMNWNWDDQPGPCKLWCYSYVLGNEERLLSDKLSCFDDSGFLSIIICFFFPVLFIFNYPMMLFACPNCSSPILPLPQNLHILPRDAHPSLRISLVWPDGNQ